MFNFADEFSRRVETIFKTEFQLLHPGMPVQWDEVTFKQPKNDPWVAFTILENAAEQVSLGRKFVERTSGFIQIDVMYPTGGGVSAAKKIGHDAANIFAHRKFKAETISVSFFEKEVVKAPVDGDRIRIMARIFFLYDGTRIREGVQHIA